MQSVIHPDGIQIVADPNVRRIHKAEDLIFDACARQAFQSLDAVTVEHPEPAAQDVDRADTLR